MIKCLSPAIFILDNRVLMMSSGVPQRGNEAAL